MALDPVEINLIRDLGHGHFSDVQLDSSLDEKRGRNIKKVMKNISLISPKNLPQVSVKCCGGNREIQDKMCKGV